MKRKDPYSQFRIVSRIEHMHLCTQLYIGQIGDGTSIQDGIYTLIRKIFESRLEEFRMKMLDTIEVNTIGEKRVSMRDNGSAINLERLIKYIHFSNAKNQKRHEPIDYDFWFVAANGMSKDFEIHCYQNGIARSVVSEYGKIVSDKTFPTQEKNGIYVCFEPDETIFGDFKYDTVLIHDVLDSYSYLTTGLTIKNNNARISAPYGLADLIRNTIYSSHALYPIIHFAEDNIEVAFTHVHAPWLVQKDSAFFNQRKTVSANEHSNVSSIFLSFVNGTITELGGVHQTSLKTSIVKTMRDFFGSNYNSNDILNGIVAAVSIWVKEPLFEDSGKYKLGGTYDSTDGKSIKQSVGDLIKKKLKDYLCDHTDIADIIKSKINENNRSRKNNS